MLVVIVILGIIFGLLYALLPGFSSYQSEEFQSAETYVTGILKETAEHCISLIGMRGGRVSQSQFASFPFGEVEASFQNAAVFLTQADLGDELSGCVEAKLSVCSEGKALLENFGSDVTTGTPTVTTVLAKENTLVQLDWQIEISGTDGRQVIRSFAAEIPVRLQTLHGLIDQVSREQEHYEQPGDFDLTTLGKQEINTTIISYGARQLMMLRDHHSKINNKDYVFLTASAFEE